VKAAAQLVFADGASEMLATLPAQLPDQPAKVDPEAGVAVSVTDASLVRLAVQVVPQFIPAGDDVTVPAPVPDLVTVSETVVGAMTLKFALQVNVALSAITVLAAVPEQLPDQPANVDPLAGVAVNVTAVFNGNVAEQVLPQEMPTGLELTVPLPIPPRVTNKLAVVTGGGVVGVAINVAVQLALTDSTAVNVLGVPEQCPDQPLKVEPLAAVANNVMLVLTGKFATHVLPQEMPVGNVVTVPLPVPALMIVRL
jgi:hypothetical protein